MIHSFVQLRKVLARKLLFPLLLLNCLILNTSGQYYGMQFSSHEYILDQRSGLDLTPDQALPIKGNLELQFHLRFQAGEKELFGYVFRLLVDNQNIDLIHAGIDQNPKNFELIIGDKTSKIAFQVPVELMKTEWVKFRFILDFNKQEIACHINDTVLVDDLKGFDDAAKFRLMFGAHSFGNFSTTDVPAMILRDVEIKCNEKKCYKWPLNETQGSIAHSSPEGNPGFALNPVWLLKKHNTWNPLMTSSFTGEVRTTFNALDEEIYFVSNDSLHIFDVEENRLKSINLQSSSGANRTWQLIYDTSSSRLLKYSLDYNYVSYFDFETNQWSQDDPDFARLTAYWHHNRAIIPDGTLVAIGGYGYHNYKNLLLAWNPENRKFDSISYNGVYHPKYLAGSGYNPKDSLYYIVGGYGSEGGKQTESPDYYHEIISYSLKDNTFSQVTSLPSVEDGFCFANSIVFDDLNNLYGLSFNKYHFDNKLQLLKISLETSDIVKVGDPIDYSFLDVQSYADLYYSKSTNSLLAVSTYFANGSTEFSVHSIAFPPQVYIEEVITPEEKKSNLPLIIIVFFVILISAYVLYSRLKNQKTTKNKAEEKPRLNIQKSKENSIILFGGFQVIDKNGKDITGQFTPLPKKLFLFILLHSLRNNKGVSSNTLYETFWFDKSVESARNNRAVNIVKLKSLLENLDSTSISKDTGYWKFDFDPSKIYIDFFEYLQIISNPEPKKEDVVDLMSITENKPFLHNLNADWLDSFKSDVSNDLIDTFLKYSENADDDPDFLLHLTKCIFLFDSVSEEALKIQCRILIKQGKHSLAKKTYSRFQDEYRQLYDEDYGLSFNQVIEE